MRAKKGAIPFNITLVVFLVAILIYAWLQLANKYGSFDRKIGEKQYELISIYQKAEKSLFYIDQSAKYSLQQAIYELAKNGGSAGTFDIEDVDSSSESLAEKTDETIVKNDCGSFNGVNAWYSIRKDKTENHAVSCFDENIAIANLKYIFNKKLNGYLINYPSNILTDNYNYEANGNLEIIGRAIQSLKFDILKKEPKKEKQIFKEPTEITEPEIQKNLVDFTGTELCRKGKRCLLTKEAYQLLKNAQEIANQKKVSLELIQGYRTLGEQAILWNRNPNSDLVCPPTAKCPHLSGNAVDVSFRGKTKGTMTKSEQKLLYEIMAQAGWVRYPVEWWHFECCGTKRYEIAKAKGVTEVGRV